MYLKSRNVVQTRQEIQLLSLVWVGSDEIGQSNIWAGAVTQKPRMDAKLPNWYRWIYGATNGQTDRQTATKKEDPAQ